MLRELDDLPEISSISGPYKGVTELELEGPVDGAKVSDDKVIFIGRFCAQIVCCVGRVLAYESESSDFAKMNIRGTYVSFIHEISE